MKKNNNSQLKNILKTLKLNENNISMILGALVIVIVGILLVNYVKDKKSNTLTGISTQSQNTREHIVTKGETLWSIAENSYGSGYNWTDIKDANKLTTDTIEVGQRLNIPDVTVKKPTMTKSVTVARQEVSVPVNTYKVVKGDCLWKIAVNIYGNGFRWRDIAKANNLKRPGLIHPGNVLSIPK